MQIILHYSWSRRPCRFKHLRGHLDLSHYLDSGCSVMNKVFPTSAALAWWAFKVPLHSVCVARFTRMSEPNTVSRNPSQVANSGGAAVTDRRESERKPQISARMASTQGTRPTFWAFTWKAVEILRNKPALCEQTEESCSIWASFVRTRGEKPLRNTSERERDSSF